ncbi:tRNA (adenosine(37)-N6)-threonylcarbamoyltransferase complex ATPase subunit type 1 TsaE [Neorhodopirellula pilleata]|uniref:tRNA (adenosine(37)-N6)-threonylcarbamoyltransferase complex ATPase subunit type 1 TsaE n=1 Tax=Neorhodopirellula pilleata TaxID=2714738 RepID=UPI001E41AAF5|nr:tRNA (adenosine(37)-N6)-threonylcarbamoyltransferase complex ATPase subunit type 1 TsaE [Neorhodopirellula pilleata]
MSILTDTMVATSCRSDSNESPVVIGLVGTLGAGKTRFCQELARSLNIASDEVTSPTFTLLRSYEVPRFGGTGLESPEREPNRPRRWHHLDLYRVRDEDELWEIGIEELWDERGAWTVMEWADRFADQMPSETVWIEIRLSTRGECEAREILVHCQHPEHAIWWERVTTEMKLAKNP